MAARPQAGRRKRTVLRKVAFIGDYPPRQCGIATFTEDLYETLAAEHPEIGCFVVAVSDRSGGYRYPPRVRFEFPEQDLASYRRAADFLNINDVDLVCLQHEHSIYGGQEGGYLLVMLVLHGLHILPLFYSKRSHKILTYSNIMF
jgi:hypothetical protein